MWPRKTGRWGGYFYPRPPRGGRRPRSPRSRGSWTFLSTPSARRATLPRAIIERRIAISIHALREEGDTYHPHMHLLLCVFLSTPSARRATSLNTVSRLISMISIHALREEGDQKTRIASGPRGRFLSTPSARRATAKVKPGVQHGVISIHALREEGDRLKPDYFSTTFDFYPRPPRGGRRISCAFPLA